MLVAGVTDASWDESAPAGAGFGQDAPAAPPTDDWGAAPGATGGAGKFLAVRPFQLLVLQCSLLRLHMLYCMLS